MTNSLTPYTWVCFFFQLNFLPLYSLRSLGGLASIYFVWFVYMKTCCSKFAKLYENEVTIFCFLLFCLSICHLFCLFVTIRHYMVISRTDCTFLQVAPMHTALQKTISIQCPYSQIYALNMCLLTKTGKIQNFHKCI